MSDKYIPILSAYLDKKRFEHSMFVAFKCVEFAKKFKIDKEKAKTAGMLHDITKNFTNEEHLEIFNEYSVTLTPIEKASPKIWHAISGSLYVKHKLHIDDDDIINAIRYHTTGRKNMSLLEKIVYLSDVISEDRTYETAEIIRQTAVNDFEDGLLYALKFSMDTLITEDLPIHPGTLDAYNDIVLRRERIETL